jgi:hypothetical protein
VERRRRTARLPGTANSRIVADGSGSNREDAGEARILVTPWWVHGNRVAHQKSRGSMSDIVTPGAVPGEATRPIPPHVMRDARPDYRYSMERSSSELGRMIDSGSLEADIDFVPDHMGGRQRSSLACRLAAGGERRRRRGFRCPAAVLK